MANRFLTTARFQEAFWDSSPIPLSIVDRQGVFIECNPAWTEMLGYARSELEGKHFRDITHPADLVADLAEVERLATDHEAEGYSMVKRYLHKQGSAIWVELHARAVRDSAGGLEYFAVCILPLPVAPVVPPHRSEPSVLSRLVTCFVDVVQKHPRQSLAAAVLGIAAVGRIPLDSLIRALENFVK